MVKPILRLKPETLEKTEKMVQVTSTPVDETTPILDVAHRAQDDDLKAPSRSSLPNDCGNNIARSTVGDNLTIDNPLVALQLLVAAVNQQNIPLTKQCVAILNGHIDKSNVVTLLLHIGKCKKKTECVPNDFQPSAPPIVEDDSQRAEELAQTLIENLHHNCLLEIDKNADEILKQKEISELSYNEILTITTRDTLQVSDESNVYSAIMRWGMEECKRKMLTTQLINIKAVLRDLVYAPRYGLMSKKMFLSRTIDGMKGPDRSGILEENETERILNYIKKRGKKSLEPLPFKLSTERKIGNEKPIGFSINGKETCRNSCDKFLINFLTCWTAVFD